EVAWEAIKGFDAMDEPSSPWFSLGLPTPMRCTLDGEGEGARRTCHFDTGTIEQRVERWEPPKQMDLEIVRVDLPGDRWLDFPIASYTLSEERGGTRITRTTRIASKLWPRWYFEPLERLAVTTEHEYLLREFARRIQETRP